MKSRRMITGALLILCSIAPVAASTIRTNLGTLPEGEFGIAGNVLALSRSFQNTVRFTRSNTSTLNGLVVPVGLANARWSLAKTQAPLKTGALTQERYTFADLTPDSSAAVFGP